MGGPRGYECGGGIVLKKTEESISHILQIQLLLLLLIHWPDEAGGCLGMAHGKLWQACFMVACH